MAGGIVPGEEQGFVQETAPQEWVRFGRFEDRAAAPAFGKQGLRHIEERIDAGFVNDFLANKLDGFGRGNDLDGDPGGGAHFFAQWWSGAIVAAVASVEPWSVLAETSTHGSISLSTMFRWVAFFG